MNAFEVSVGYETAAIFPSKFLMIYKEMLLNSMIVTLTVLHLPSSLLEY